MKLDRFWEITQQVLALLVVFAVVSVTFFEDGPADESSLDEPSSPGVVSADAPPVPEDSVGDDAPAGGEAPSFPGSAAAFWDEHTLLGKTATEVIALAGEPSGGQVGSTLTYRVVTDVGREQFVTLVLDAAAVVVRRETSDVAPDSR